MLHQNNKGMQKTWRARGLGNADELALGIE